MCPRQLTKSGPPECMYGHVNAKVNKVKNNILCCKKNIVMSEVKHEKVISVNVYFSKQLFLKTQNVRQRLIIDIKTYLLVNMYSSYAIKV